MAGPQPGGCWCGWCVCGRWPDAAPRPSLPSPPPAPSLHPSTHPQLAEEEEFEAKRKELEEVSSPIFARLYQQGGGAPEGGMPGGPAPGGPATGPTVEEVD